MKNIWSREPHIWSRSQPAPLHQPPPFPAPRPSHFLSRSSSQCCFNPLRDRPRAPRSGAGSEEGVGDAGGRPGAHIPNKAASQARQAVALQRVPRTRRREGSGARERSGGRAGGLPPHPPTPLPPWPGALPRPLPRTQRRSYRNSAGSWCRDAPRGGPGPRGRAPEVREEGEREKFEKQASRGEPDKPGPGRAGAIARAGRGLGPRELDRKSVV